MKTKTFKLTILLAIFFVGMNCSAIGQSKAGDKKIKGTQLLKNNSLNNWVFYLKDQSVDPSTVFTIKEGVAHITGTQFGYMRTKKSYSDYKLHVEYRWPSEATNSGVFIHCQLPDTIWITGIECQLAKGNAGDFACVGETDMKERTDKTRKGRMIKKMAESSEKAVGEWNTLDITCKGNTIEVIVNGVLQNKGSEVNVSQGYIVLQSEGKDVEFRNVILSDL
jgi:hypothetical protein